MRAGAALGRQSQYPRTQRSDDAAVRGYPVFVQFVQVSVERLNRLVVLAECLWVADADAEQEATRVNLLDPVKRLGDDAPGAAIQVVMTPVATRKVVVLRENRLDERQLGSR